MEDLLVFLSLLFGISFAIFSFITVVGLSWLVIKAILGLKIAIISFITIVLLVILITCGIIAIMKWCFF